MTRRWRTAFTAALISIGVTGCEAPPGPRVRPINLLHMADRAEKRPAEGAFDIVDHACGGRHETSLAVPPTSRVIQETRLPARAVFTSRIAVDGPPGSAVMFRVGVSDERVYEQLATMTVSTEDCDKGWGVLEVDLSRFSGWKFSIFYQPSRRAWRLVLGANTAAGAPGRAYWGNPGIETDNESAGKFFRQSGER